MKLAGADFRIGDAHPLSLASFAPSNIETFLRPGESANFRYLFAAEPDERAEESGGHEAN